MGKRRVPLVQPPSEVDSLLAKPVEAELDLHGRPVPEAAKAVEFFLVRWACTRPGIVVRIITGRGNRSSGAPVLKPLVARLLTGSLAKHVERHTEEAAGGAFLIQLR